MARKQLEVPELRDYNDTELAIAYMRLGPARMRRVLDVAAGLVREHAAESIAGAAGDAVEQFVHELMGGGSRRRVRE